MQDPHHSRIAISEYKFHFEFCRGEAFVEVFQGMIDTKLSRKNSRAKTPEECHCVTRETNVVSQRHMLLLMRHDIISRYHDIIPSMYMEHARDDADTRQSSLSSS